MKILHTVEGYALEGNTNTIGFANLQQVAASVSFNLEAVLIDEITFDEVINIPYNDVELTKALRGLAYEIASNTDFVYPDYGNIKTSIAVDVHGKTFKPTLVIEVQPPQYTADEKAEILATANQNTFDTDFSEYTIWQDILESAEAFFQQGGCSNGENIGMFDIEFEHNELKEFMFLWLQYSAFDMTANKELTA